MITRFNLYAKVVFWFILACLVLFITYLVTDAAGIDTMNRSLVMIIALSVSLTLILFAVHRLLRPLYRLSERLLHESTASLHRDPLTTTDAADEFAELYGQVQSYIDDHARLVQEQISLSVSFTHFIAQSRQLLEQDMAAIQKQRQLFHDVRILIDDWSKWIPSLFRHLDEIRYMSDKHAEYTTYNAELLETTRPALDAVNDQIESRNRFLDELSKKIQSVLIINKRIHALTDQTKLIAFNAAIEASTTGDTGRRFNVVASDIRKLAGTVDNANDSMSELITEMETLFRELKDHLSRDEPHIALIRNSFSQIGSVAGELARIMKSIDGYANQWLSALNRQQKQIDNLQMTFQEIHSAHQQFHQTHRQLEDSIRRRMDTLKNHPLSIHRNTP